ncbi:MAG: YebC/PmpR family DNA-binding transcriptional regulator [Bacteroidota bacterium]
MSGHSKWATIKRKKAVIDAARGRAFTQLIKEITVAARIGGGDLNGNPRLRFAIDKAKASNMPADNIKRAIMKGTGELPGVTYEDVTYEGYGPGGAALLLESVTDNKNRTVSEIRHILERHNGKLASSGAVAFQFSKKGTIIIQKAGLGEEDVMNIVLDNGADDMQTTDDAYEIITTPHAFENVKKALEGKGIKIEHADIQMVPQNHVKVEGKEAEQLLKLMEALEEHDDIQHVYANFDIDDSILAAFNS